MKKVVCTLLAGGMMLSGCLLLNTHHSQASTVEEPAPRLTSAQTIPLDPAIKKGSTIFVVIKNTKQQKVSVLNRFAHKTGKYVAMGTRWKVKKIKQIRQKKILQIKSKEWLDAKNIVKD